MLAVQFSAIIAASIFAFVQAKPVPQGVDYSTIDYSNNGVDYSTIDYSNNGVDYSTIDYSNNGVDYKTINYNAAAPTPVATSTVQTGASTRSPVSVVAPTSTGINLAFSLISVHSGDVNVHLRPIYAANSTIKLGGPTTPQSFTPSGIDVPTTNRTTFSTGDSVLALRDVVPGGQRVYMGADGTLGYTVPHSGLVPEGAVATGFSLSEPGTDGKSPNQVLLFDGRNNFLACPNGDTSYNVVVSNKSTRTDCVGLVMVAGNATAVPAAWQW